MGTKRGDRNVDGSREAEDEQEKKEGIMRGREIVQFVDKIWAMILYHFVCLNTAFVFLRESFQISISSCRKIHCLKS